MVIHSRIQLRKQWVLFEKNTNIQICYEDVVVVVCCCCFFWGGGGGGGSIEIPLLPGQPGCAGVSMLRIELLMLQDGYSAKYHDFVENITLFSVYRVRMVGWVQLPRMVASSLCTLCYTVKKYVGSQIHHAGHAHPGTIQGGDVYQGGNITVF